MVNRTPFITSTFLLTLDLFHFLSRPFHYVPIKKIIKKQGGVDKKEKHRLSPLPYTYVLYRSTPASLVSSYKTRSMAKQEAEVLRE